MTIKTRFPSIEPSLDLNFAATKRLDPRITFTRASSATFVNEDGLIEAAGVNQARFDHTPTTGESLGLLVEEARTNNSTYSEDTSQWLTPTNITLSQNQTTAPDNLVTADQYLETAATGLHVQDGVGFVFVTGTTYTYSVFVKSIGGRNFTIVFPVTVFTARFANFNLSGIGSVVSQDLGVTASITPYPNGWYRCSATSTCAFGTGARMSNFITNSSYSISYAGDVTKGIYIWGAQLEAGAFPTSYIPTTTATVTRAADVASITGTAFSSWYRQDEGTFYSENRIGGFQANNYPNVFNVNDSTNNNVINNYRLDYAIRYTYGVISGGVAQTSFSQSPTIAAGAVAKMATAVATNNGILVVNGTEQGADTSLTMPTGINRLQIPGGGDMTIKRLTYWPTRLANSTLQTLTQ